MTNEGDEQEIRNTEKRINGLKAKRESFSKKEKTRKKIYRCFHTVWIASLGLAIYSAAFLPKPLDKPQEVRQLENAIDYKGHLEEKVSEFSPPYESENLRVYHSKKDSVLSKLEKETKIVQSDIKELREKYAVKNYNESMKEYETATKPLNKKIFLTLATVLTTSIGGVISGIGEKKYKLKKEDAERKIEYQKNLKETYETLEKTSN